MNPTLEIQKIRLQLRKLNVIDDRIALYKEAIRIADSHNILEKGFTLRLELISEEKETARCIESFPAFTWILNTYDNNTDIFEEDDFLWEYKWMVGSARRNTGISMEQIENITEDCKTRLARNGYSLRTYYTFKIHMAFFLDNLEDAKKYLELRRKEIRDSMSNCEACEIDDEVGLYMKRGEIKKALLVGDKLLSKKVTCVTTPFITYCRSLIELHKAGEKEKAQEFFDKAEEHINTKLEYDTSRVADIGDLINYLCVIGDRDKAWDYFQKYSWWNIDSEDAINFRFTCSVLPLLKEEGKKELSINTKLPYYNKSGEYNIGELYTYYYNIAKDLATRFDERNGTGYFTECLEGFK